MQSARRFLQHSRHAATGWSHRNHGAASQNAALDLYAVFADAVFPDAPFHPPHAALQPDAAMAMYRYHK